METLYVNENFPQPVVLLLRNLGHDVLTSLDAGNANQRIPDEDVVAFATTHSRIVLTLNRRDFIKIHKSNPIHSGIIVCTEDIDYEGFTSRIDTVLRENADNFQNQLFKIYRPS